MVRFHNLYSNKQIREKRNKTLYGGKPPNACKEGMIGGGDPLQQSVW